MKTEVLARLRRKVRLRTRVRNFLAPDDADDRSKVRIIDAFHRLYYDEKPKGGTWGATFWMGTPVQKCPLDLWIYQEIIDGLRPDLIIETGTADGGSAHFMANICDLVGKGRIVTIDILAGERRPAHPRITYLLGSSTSPSIADRVRGLARGAGTVLVILDSDHSKNHVLDELALYSDLVSPGSYLIVEDTNVNGHPVNLNHGPGPMEAIDVFMQKDQRFRVDRSREKFLLTFNPRGFLLRNR
ncbi:MAG: cephalosporin hydroxylase [Chloroflexi bacterium]|nr:MAG: cephalosporin hydroxylase [Chloroflexota bacterium]